MKNVAVLTEDGAFALFLRPHPQEFAIQGQKMLMPGGQPGKGGGGLGVGRTDWCITVLNTNSVLLVRIIFHRRHLVTEKREIETYFLVSRTDI